MSLVLVTPPAEEPLTLAEAKLHLRETSTAEETLIQDLIVAARQRVEEVTGLALLTQTWDLTLDRFPCASRENPWTAFLMPKVPLISVTTITYTATDGTSTVLDSALYTVDIKSKPARITPAYGESWPSTRDIPNAVTVRFVAGHGASPTSIPEPIRHALRVELGTLFMHREDFVTGTLLWPTNTLRSLLANYRVYGGMS